jgi:hypothetical protein
MDKKETIALFTKIQEDLAKMPNDEFRFRLHESGAYSLLPLPRRKLFCCVLGCNWEIFYKGLLDFSYHNPNKICTIFQCKRCKREKSELTDPLPNFKDSYKPQGVIHE